jgi:hypothetical protein
LHPAKAAFITALLNYLTFCVGIWRIEGRTSIGPPCTQTHHPIKKILQCTLVFGSYVQGRVVGHSFLKNDKLRRITETHKGLDPSSSAHELPAADLKSLTQLTAFISPLRSNCTASCDLQISQNAFLLVSFTAFKLPVIPNCSLPVVTFEFPKKLLVWFPLQLL